MKLIELIPVMEEELNTMDMFSAEMVNHLSYTRNFYLLEKNGKKVITNKKVTLITLQSFMDLTSYEAFILDENEAVKALKILEMPKVEDKPEKKTTPKTAPKKQKPKKKSVPVEIKEKKVEPVKKKKSGK